MMDAQRPKIYLSKKSLQIQKTTTIHRIDLNKKSFTIKTKKVLQFQEST